MKLTVLVENSTLIDKYLLGEPGLAFLLEVEGKKILFDTGYSDVFIENAFRMGISLADFDYVVISHGHNDHTGGLKYLLRENFTKKPGFIAHPEVLEPKLYGVDEKIGVDVTQEELSEKFNVDLSRAPRVISENVVFLGEIPRKSELEPLAPYGKKLLTGKPDYLLDDSALAIKTSKGIVVLTACSHSGIINICEYAKEVCGCDKIVSIIGGLHLLRASEDRIMKIIEYLRKQNLEVIYPCHCTGFHTICEMYKSLNVKEIGCGSELELF